MHTRAKIGDTRERTNILGGSLARGDSSLHAAIDIGFNFAFLSLSFPSMQPVISVS